ncbi:MAG: YhfC family intramembrane metalloprotease [Oscillospiraceae bacterium]|nr:YhfC family intramembrane metalloprotease [Oscillospiraceae bacterium]
MSDVSCLLAGMTRLLFPFLLLLIWRRRTGALLYPALVAFLVTVPVFVVAGGIRSGFSQDDFVLFHLQTGLLFGIFEEGGKYLALRYALESYDSRKNAVTYGIGHSIWEEIGAGVSCIGLIGTGNAAPDIFPVNLFFALFGAADTIALTVLIFYGIRTGRSKVMLPAAILLHALGNAVNGIFSFSLPIMVGFGVLLTAGMGYAAYRCWAAMRDPYEEEL